MTEHFLVALEIGGTKMQATLGLADGTLVERRRGVVDRAAGAPGILAWMEAQTKALIEAAPQEVCAIGIGFGGPVESATGRALVSHQIAGWEGLPLRAWFADRFHVPVVVANDANAAGWAEYRLGAGRGTRQFCYMNIGSGIGGALVLDGRLYDGQGRGAAEIGHTWVPDWTASAPGAAEKLENLCSGWAIERRLHSMQSIKAETPLHDLCGGNPAALTCPLLAEAARQNDAVAQEEIHAIANAVGAALGNVVTLFHPECIALGGGVALMGDVLLDPIRDALARYVFAPYRETVRLAPCALEEDVVTAGALLLAADLPEK